MIPNSRLTKLPKEVKDALASGRWGLFANSSPDTLAIKSDVGIWFIVNSEGELLSTSEGKPATVGNPVIMKFTPIRDMMNKRTVNA